MKKTFRFMMPELFALTLGAGCSALQGRRMPVRIEASEAKAEITANGERLGPSPVTAFVARNQPLTVVARKEGFETATVRVPYRLSNTGFADAVGAFICLFPGIGLLTPGAWVLEQDYVFLPMTRQAEPTGASETIPNSAPMP